MANFLDNTFYQLPDAWKLLRGADDPSAEAVNFILQEHMSQFIALIT